MGTSDLLGTFRGIPVYRGGKRLRQVHASQEPAGAAAAAEGGHPAKRHRRGGGLSAPAEPGSAGFSRHRQRGSAVGLSQRPWTAVLLLRRREVAGADAHGQAGDIGIEGSVLPGAVRRTAAAGAAGTGAVRRPAAADPGRAGDGAGPRRRTGPVPDAGLSQQK